jgi:hypothetical protein
MIRGIEIDFTIDKALIEKLERMNAIEQRLLGIEVEERKQRAIDLLDAITIEELFNPLGGLPKAA